VANPYWNAPVQGLLEPNGNYPTFDTFPAGIGSATAAYGTPYTATLLLQYKRGRLAVTPAMQFFAGQRYGVPATTDGVAPDTCTGPVLGSTVNDPRYNFGAAGGSAYAYENCGFLTGGIPDKYTGKFDTLGAFADPMVFQLHLQLAYDLSNRVSLVVNLANVINDCFGGTKTGFTVKGACSYTYVGNGYGADVGNTYDPGHPIQPYVNTPYDPLFGTNPFGIFVSARVKI
jgi:hypothetical protein